MAWRAPEVRSTTPDSALPLTSDPRSAGLARRHVRSVLQDWSLGALVDTVELLTSELVTNVLLHAPGGGQLWVERHGDGVRVTVADSSPLLPSQRRHSTTATTGRGCALVEELADEWGVEPRASGKAVWFVVHPSREPSAPVDPSGC